MRVRVVCVSARVLCVGAGADQRRTGLAGLTPCMVASVMQGPVPQVFNQSITSPELCCPPPPTHAHINTRMLVFRRWQAEDRAATILEQRSGAVLGPDTM